MTFVCGEESQFVFDKINENEEKSAVELKQENHKFQFNLNKFGSVQYIFSEWKLKGMTGQYS